METTKPSPPLVELPPRSAVIVVMLLPGPPPVIQMDLMRTGTAGDGIVARYQTTPANVMEAASAFEMLLGGTLMGQKLQPSTLVQFPTISRTQ